MPKRLVEPATEQAALDALNAGIKPRDVESAYRRHVVRQYAAQRGMTRQDLTALALRWGITKGAET